MDEEEVIGRFNDLQKEILKIGWVGILKKYHPDNNLEHPMAFEVFKTYKSIYESMLERVEVTPHTQTEENN